MDHVRYPLAKGFKIWLCFWTIFAYDSSSWSSKSFGEITDVQIIAAGPGIRVQRYLRKAYGRGRWRKLKGTATIRLPNGMVHRVELHWYEAHGKGKRDVKIKRYLDE